MGHVINIPLRQKNETLNANRFMIKYEILLFSAFSSSYGYRYYTLCFRAPASGKVFHPHNSQYSTNQTRRSQFEDAALYNHAAQIFELTHSFLHLLHRPFLVYQPPCWPMGGMTPVLNGACFFSVCQN